MPVLGHAVRPDAFVAFAKQVIHLGLAARAADAAERIGDDAGRLDQPRLQQRNHRQQNAGRITARGGDEQGFLDFVAINFRQTINRLAQQIRRGMVVRVKFLVNRRALEPEIGAQVNHLAARVEQRHGEFGGDAVRQRQKHHLRLLGEQFGLRLGEAQRFGARMTGELGEDLRQRLPGVLARGDGDQFRVGMVQQQPDEFFAGVTRRADDCDFLRIHISKF